MSESLVDREHVQGIHDQLAVRPRHCRGCWGDDFKPEPEGPAPPPAAPPPAREPETGARGTLAAGLLRVQGHLARARARVTKSDTAPVVLPAQTVSCTACGDARWVRLDRPVGHPEFGKAVPCRRCFAPELRHRYIDELMGRGEIPPWFREADVETYPVTEQSRAGYERIVDWWNRVRLGRAERRSLYVWGPNNIGKTWLACAILREWEALQVANASIGHPFEPVIDQAECGQCGGHVGDHPQEAQFLSEVDLLDAIRGTYRRASGRSADALMSAVQSAPFVVLDDLGGSQPTMWVAEKLFQLIGGRHDANLPTIFTSNCPPDELGSQLASAAGQRDADPSTARIARRQSERIMWRLVEMATIVPFDGPNLRDQAVRAQLGLHVPSGALRLPMDDPAF